MEEVIQVLVFIVIVTSVIISKYKEVHVNRPGQHAQQPCRGNNEVFPDMDEEDTDQELDQEMDSDQSFQSVVDLNEPNELDEVFGGEFLKRNQTRQQEEIPTAEQTVLTPTTAFAQYKNSAIESNIGTINLHKNIEASQPISSDLTSQTVRVKKKPKIQLRTRQEARQAFIYSEIFNRKYE